MPHGYTSLAQLVSDTPSAFSLYHNSIWSSGAMHTSGPFVQNLTSQPIVDTAVTSVPVEPTIPNPLISSFQLTVIVQPTALS